ncbi:MAG: hypothetical protein JST04_11765 [Bdellovibrionales bacterium]|nr:hypothetical protein [Bdellovibrionales bacterium]
MIRFSIPAWIPMIAAFVAASPNAHANGGQTHGGTAVVCRSPDGSIARAEVLDLFEARELLGVRPMQIVDADWARTAILWALRYRYRGRSIYADTLERTIDELRYRFKFLEPGRHVELIPDVFPKIGEVGCASRLRATVGDRCTFRRLLAFDERCEIEQLASFDDDGAILIDSEIYESLDPLNRLAIELHEGAYYLDRKYRRAKDSTFARRLVGLLLADHPDARLDPMIDAYRFLLGDDATVLPLIPRSF